MKKSMISLLALAMLGTTSLGITASAANIPRPGEIEVTRDNYQRIVNMLQEAGLNRAEIKRWINASLNAGGSGGDGPHIGEREIDRATGKVRDRAIDRSRDRTGDRAAHGRSVNLVRPARVERIQRPSRPVRLDRVRRPDRPTRPARPSRLG